MLTHSLRSCYSLPHPYPTFCRVWLLKTTCNGPMVARFLLRVMIPIALGGCSWHSSCPSLREVLSLLSHPGREIFPHGATHMEHSLNLSTEIRLVQFLSLVQPQGFSKCNRKGDLGVFWRKKTENNLPKNNHQPLVAFRSGQCLRKNQWD